jgi:hypothetical protein
MGELRKQTWPRPSIMQPRTRWPIGLGGLSRVDPIDAQRPEQRENLSQTPA